MRQIFQQLGTGEVRVEQVPTPQVAPGRVLIKTEISLISAGTERMLVGFGRSGILQKVRSQPEKVRQVLAKMKTDGLMATLNAVRTKLADPMPMGYSQAGRVLAVGQGVTTVRVGDRVISNGPHAERVLVPENLVARVPEGVALEDAVFTVVGSIGLQGIRLLQPTLGESFVVLGLGLIGQLAVQMLIANGCRVLAVDLDPKKVAMAESFGATGFCMDPSEGPVKAALAFTNQVGVDGVLITAATSSNGPIEQSAEMCRKRGRIILVGVVGLNIPRDSFYKKELSFQVSCSYGAGRYDSAYEEDGRDYPIGYVRWTEKRNFEAFLDLMRTGRIRTDSLRDAIFPITQAKEAYDLLLKNREALGILLTYPEQEPDARTLQITGVPTQSSQLPGIAVIGTGNYARATLLPLLEKCPPHRRVLVVSQMGASAVHAAKRFEFERAGNDVEEILSNPEIDGVIIATRHDSHAEIAARVLAAGKHVYVEKPLATTMDGLEAVEKAWNAAPGLYLTVGFNRRHAPMSIAIKEALKTRKSPLVISCQINAGELPSDHWAVDPISGGGRVLGEGCHFIDLMRFWTGSALVGAHTLRARTSLGGPELEDIAIVTLTFEDGSLGTLQYLSNGSKAFPKEEFTLFWEGKQARLTNFRKVQFWGMSRLPIHSRWSQDKGHLGSLAHWIKAMSDPTQRIPATETLEISRWAIRADHSKRISEN